MPIPRKLFYEACRRGVDVQEAVLSCLAKILRLDPDEVARARLVLAEKMLSEAREYITKGDVVQASEKLCKAVEECIKALAERLRVSQPEEVEKRGRWDTWLLGRAATDLSRKLNEERVSLAWSKAYEINVWGFHEAKYRIEDVEIALPLAEWLLSYAKQVIEEGS